MPEHTIRELVALEYDFVHLASDTDTLAGRVARLQLPEAGPIAERLHQLRYAIESLLHRLDKPISDAVAAVEQLEPAPF